MTFLIVDDLQLMRSNLKNLINDMGGKNQVLEAGNGVEAFRKLESQPVDLILSDWNMPEMSGIDFIKKLKETDKYKAIPIIMITSEDDKTNVIEALKAGARDYIVKPVNEKNFREKIANVIKK
jgi:two-component system chemotaxis response regulator CheY